MRFLVDESTGPAVAAWMKNIGHEVYSVFSELQGSTDDEILTKAFDEKWILITNDKDFGEMIFRERRLHRGVIFLRLTDERSANKIAVLEKVLELFADRLENQFVTATESRIRFS